jgi:uncharacterized protein
MLDLDALEKQARPLLPGCLFLTVSGAHLYGFPSQDSDIDLRGCHQLPLEELIGLRQPNETRQPKFEHTGLPVEVVSHEVGKYLRLLARNNGYILEQVFSPLVVFGRDFLDQLRPLAQRCVTRGCYNHYRGFFYGQLKLLEREEVKKAKSLLYAYRVLLTCVHLLETGEVQANLLDLNRKFGLPFLDDLVRRKQARELGGLDALDWNWHRQELARWESRLDQELNSSPLAKDPPWEELNRFLVRLRLDQDLGE